MSKWKRKFTGAKKSLVVKFNTLMAAILPSLLYAQDSLPLLREFMTIEVYQIVGLVVVSANIALSFWSEKSE